MAVSNEDLLALLWILRLGDYNYCWEVLAIYKRAPWDTLKEM